MRHEIRHAQHLLLRIDDICCFQRNCWCWQSTPSSVVFDFQVSIRLSEFLPSFFDRANILSLFDIPPIDCGASTHFEGAEILEDMFLLSQRLSLSWTTSIGWSSTKVPSVMCMLSSFKNSAKYRWKLQMLYTFWMNFTGLNLHEFEYHMRFAQLITSHVSFRVFVGLKPPVATFAQCMMMMNLHRVVQSSSSRALLHGCPECPGLHRILLHFLGKQCRAHLSFGSFWKNYILVAFILGIATFWILAPQARSHILRHMCYIHGETGWEPICVPCFWQARA